jgi:hypothetical protein
MKSSLRKICLILLLASLTVSLSGCPNTNSIFTGYSELSLSIQVSNNSQIECAFPEFGFPGFSFDMGALNLFPTDPDVIDQVNPDLSILTISEIFRVDLANFEPQILGVRASTGNYSIKLFRMLNVFMFPGANSQNVCAGTEIPCDPNSNPCSGSTRGDKGGLACVRRCGGGPALPCSDLPSFEPFELVFEDAGFFEVTGESSIVSINLDAEAFTRAVYESHWVGGPSCAVFDYDYFKSLAPTFLSLN